MFFSRREPDNLYIYVDKKKQRRYPLLCDPVLYAQGVQSMRDILHKWILTDQALTTDTGQRSDGSISFLLATLDLKQLPRPSHVTRLVDLLSLTPINFSGSRLWDAITLIYTVVPTEVVQTYIGKFLYAMSYGVPEVDGNKQSRCTLEQWVELIDIFPVVPFLMLIQELIGDIYSEITNPLATQDKPQTVVNINGTTGAPQA